MSTRRQGKVLFSGILFLIATTVVIQLWLLTVTMEALLEGATKSLLPASVASTILFLINAGLLRYVLRFDKSVHGNR